MGELLKLVCKAFYSATYMGVPPYLLRPHPFAQWMTCFHNLLLRPVPKVSSALLEVRLSSFCRVVTVRALAVAGIWLCFLQPSDKCPA